MYFSAFIYRSVSKQFTSLTRINVQFSLRNGYVNKYRGIHFEFYMCKALWRVLGHLLLQKLFLLHYANHKMSATCICTEAVHIGLGNGNLF